MAGDVHAERGENPHGARHQTFAAGLVDGCGARLRHDGVETGTGRVERGREASGTASDDEQVVTAAHPGTARVEAAVTRAPPVR
jgi:hypothetical protein